jgi:MFS family permease
MVRNKNIKFFLNYFLAPVLFVWLSFSLYNQIRNQPNLEQSWQHIKGNFYGKKLTYLILVVLLMFINWTLETIKWKLLIQRIQAISFWKALKAISTGVSFSISTPNRIGEYFGRVLYMDDGNRLKAISLTIVGSISQLIITMLMGCIGLLILLPELEYSELGSNGDSIWIRVSFYGALVVTLLLTIFYFRLSWLTKLLNKLPGVKNYSYLINALEELTATLLLQILSLSLIRFTVFCLQYYLLFLLFNVEIGAWQGFWIVSVMFLVLASIPSIALIDLGLRGEVSLGLLGIFSANTLGIGFATAGIWFINLIIPSILGTVFIWGIKVLKNKNERI